MTTAAVGHILVVDDESEVRDLTRRALRGSGFTCDIAADGEEAFRLVSSTPYDGVVTDLRMPARHGHALCNDLMRLPDPPAVMVVTALSDHRLVRDLLERGVHDVVQKPVDYGVLAAKVEAMIKRGATRRTQVIAAKPKSSAARKVNLLHRIESTLVELTEFCGERLDTTFEHEGKLSDPPRAAREFIRRLAESEASGGGKPVAVVLPGHEDRSRDRLTCYTTAIGVTVDRKWNALGEPFKLALRDLSESGGRFLHTRAVNAKYLAICWNASQLVAKQIRVVCEIKRCKPNGPFYDLGGQFVRAD